MNDFLLKSFGESRRKVRMSVSSMSGEGKGGTVNANNKGGHYVGCLRQTRFPSLHHTDCRASGQVNWGVGVFVLLPCTHVLSSCSQNECYIYRQASYCYSMLK